MTPQPSTLAGITFRPATEADLDDCSRIHREGIDGYAIRLGMPPSPPENPGLRRLHGHTLATDPKRFMVAERDFGGGGRRVVAFGSATERGPLWFLSMLFVEPGEQARGLGRALLEHLLPVDLEGRILATCTDSAQPISNGLYATFGMVPRMPLLYLAGRPRPHFAWPGLPDGVTAEHIENAAAWREGAELADFDRSLLGFEHPEDHRFLQDEPRHVFGYRAGGTLVGYGYAGEIGRMGPIGVSDPSLLMPILGHLLMTVIPRGASAIWLPGAAGDAVAMGIRAGLRIDTMPVLSAWNRPYTEFDRYVPMSPGLV